MTLLSRLFKRSPFARQDSRKAIETVWHRVVAIARQKQWYAEMGAADSVAGRFDMICAVIAVVLVRLERESGMEQEATSLTELFVDDMDGQLREAGIGDVVVGKHIGKIMSALGGRLGAYRNALAAGGEGLEQAVERNVTMLENFGPGQLAEGLIALNRRITDVPMADLLKGEF